MSPEFSTAVQKAVSGREVRAAFMAYPRWRFSLSYEVIRATPDMAELSTLLGFFLSRHGMFDSFLYLNPADNAASAMQFGVGDGSTRTFPLSRSLGGFVEPTQNVSSPVIYLNGTPTSAYTMDGKANITFTAAPGAGVVLTWSGTFYYRCRFLADVSDFNNFAEALWDLKKLEFVGSPMNKV